MEPWKQMSEEVACVFSRLNDLAEQGKTGFVIAAFEDKRYATYSKGLGDVDRLQIVNELIDNWKIDRKVLSEMGPACQ